MTGGGRSMRRPSISPTGCAMHVETSLEGDTSFPAIDTALWKVMETIDVPAGDKDSYPTKFVVYDRR
nr:dihydrofolate reductase [Rhizobium mesoamericanum]